MPPPGSKRRPGRSLYAIFGAALVLYSILIFAQLKAWGGARAVKDIGTAPLSDRTNATQHAARASRQLDVILSKYDISLENESLKKVKVPDADRSIAFLHVGKTGGSTISMHLRNGCPATNMLLCRNRKDGWIVNETVASRRVESYYHMRDIPLEELQRLTTILTVVRHPITRFLSAFAYGHPTNMIARGMNSMNPELVQKYSCFPSISYLIKAGMGRADIPWNKWHMQELRMASLGRPYPKLKTNVDPINCTELAQIAFGLNETWAVVDDSHPWPTHMTHDYRQYYRSMPPDKELIVLRSDRLWEDWVEVNRLLGGADDPAYRDWSDVPPFQEIHRNVSGQYVMKKRWKTASIEEQIWLCRLLRDEIRTYFMIIMRAINLNQEDLLRAATDVDRLCSETNITLNNESL